MDFVLSKSNNSYRLIKVLIIIIYFALIVCGNIYIQSISSIMVLIYLIYLEKNNRIVVLIFSLMLFFNINFLVPMVFDTKDTLFVNSLYQTEYCIETIRCLNLFIIGILVFIKPAPKNLDFNIDRFIKISHVISIFLITIAFLISVFAIDRSNNEKNSGHISPIYELTYFLVFFALVFSNKKRLIVLPIILVSLFIVIQDLYYGGRITSLQVILSFFVYYINKLKLKHLFFLVFLFLLFIWIGIIRSNKEISFESFNFFKVDTFYFSFQTSETHLYVGDGLSVNNRLSSFFGNVLNTFFIDNGKVYSVSQITKEYVMHYYGGYCFSHFYFWFGYVGPFIAGVLLSIIMNFCFNKNTNIRLIILSFIAIILPRWYVYDPFILIKYGLIISVVFYGMLSAMNNSITYSTRSLSNSNLL